MLIFFCGTGNAAPLPDADYGDILAKANQKFLNLNSIHMTVDSSVSMSVQGRDMSVFTTIECDAQLKPITMKNTINIVIDPLGKRTQHAMVQYFEEAGDKFIFYSKVNNQWVKQEIPKVNPLNQYDAFLKGITQVVLVEETVDSLVLEVTISASLIQESVEKAMALPGMQKVKLPENLFQDIDDFKYTAVVDKNTMLISKMSFDMSDFIRSIAQRVAETLKVPDDKKASLMESMSSMKIVTNIAFTSFNKADKVTIPQEAKKAVLAPSRLPKTPDGPAPSQSTPPTI